MGDTTAAEILKVMLTRQKKHRIYVKRELMKRENKISGYIIGSGIDDSTTSIIVAMHGCGSIGNLIFLLMS